MSGQQQDQASTFTPLHPFKMEEPKTWASTIGGLDWDNDKIIFSKRSFLEFLKSVQMPVGTNFTEISKLPKYATFGKFSQAATDAAVADLVDAEIADPSHDNQMKPTHSTVPRPSRKVREAPGGKDSINISEEDYEETDALSIAPPRNGGSGVDVELERMERMRLHVEPVVDGGARIEDEGNTGSTGQEERVSHPPPGFRPSRKVREGPGGASTMSQTLFGDETDADREQARQSATAGRKKQQAHQQTSGFW